MIGDESRPVRIQRGIPYTVPGIAGIARSEGGSAPHCLVGLDASALEGALEGFRKLEALPREKE